MACLFCSWLGHSSAGFCVSLLPAVLCLALHYCLLPLFALLLLAPLRVSKALPLRCLGLWGFLFPCSLLPVAPGFSAAYFLTPFVLLLLPPLRVTLALPLRCPGLVRILVSLQFAPGFFSGLFSSSFCAAAVASLRVSLLSLSFG